MTSSFSKIANGLLNSRQNIIALTEQDYDATPIVVTSTQEVQIQIDLVIESKNMLGAGMIWDHPEEGIWDVSKWADDAPGFILGHLKYGVLGKSRLGSSEEPWVVEQEWINI